MRAVEQIDISDCSQVTVEVASVSALSSIDTLKECGAEAELWVLIKEAQKALKEMK